MLKSIWAQRVLSALAVAVFGFILLTLTFLLYFMVDQFMRLFINPVEMAISGWSWFMFMRHALFLLIIAAISWPVLRSGLPVLVKCIWLVVPWAAVLATIGMLLSAWLWVALLAGVLLTVAVILYLYHTKKPWLYHYTVILVTVTLTVFNLAGGEI
jgi:hypothetical protein